MSRILVNVIAPLHNNLTLQYAIELSKAQKCSIYIYYQVSMPIPIISGRFVSPNLPFEIINSRKATLEHLCRNLQIQYDIVADFEIDQLSLTCQLRNESFRRQFDILIVNVWKPFIKLNSLACFLSRNYSNPSIPTLYIPKTKKFSEIKSVISISEDSQFQKSQLSSLFDLFKEPTCFKIQTVSAKRIKLLCKRNYFGSKTILNEMNLGKVSSFVQSSTNLQNLNEIGEPDLIIIRCKTSISNVTRLVHNKSPIFFPILTN